MAVQCVISTMGLPNTNTDWNTSDPEDCDWNGLETKTEGLIGFTNLGNTCYQNAIIQCLFNNKYFVTKLSGHVTDDSDSDSIANQFILLLRSYKQQNCGAIRAEGVRDSMAKKHVTLADGRQHDAQEFLALLLDALHEQLNLHLNHLNININKRLKVCETEKCNDLNDEELASIEWNKYKQISGNSCIVDIFQGQLCSSLKCDHCSHVSKTFEPFMYLPLPLPFVRQKQLIVIFTSLNCVSTRLLLTIDNKYDSIIQLKVKLRELLSLNEVLNEDLVICEVTNVYQVTRIYDDYEDLLSINDINSQINIFQLNEVQSNKLDSIESRQCIICLDQKPITQLLNHSRNCINGNICESCLEAAVRHYTNDLVYNCFPCPACNKEVYKQHFTECQQLTDRYFSIPLLFRTRENNENSLIYRVLMIRVMSQIDSSVLYSLIDSKVPNPEYTYKLVFVERDGMGCCRCSWASTCDGCELSRDGMISLCETDTICVSFESNPQLNSFEIIEDKSMNDKIIEQKEKLNLDLCLQEFISNECLNSDENQWFCTKCQQLRSAHKSLHIIRAPKTLIIFLKRFCFISNNSYKLEESVEFPIDKPLDITKFVVNPNNESFLYTLNAFVCHFGNITSGHYTCYVRNDNEKKWFYYNDDIVTSQQPLDNDNRAYILFYTRLEDSPTQTTFSPEISDTTETTLQPNTIDAIIETLNNNIK